MSRMVELLNKMTIEEKIGQLMQIVPSLFKEKNTTELTGPLSGVSIEKEDLWNCGSVLGVYNGNQMIEIQNDYLEKSRLKIPLIFMFDVIHGYKTIFPIPLALGCSWDMNAAKTMAQTAAKEAALSGIQVNFSPMVDLVRDPRWGRVIESTGEDPYLNGKYAEAFVRGYRENDKYNVATCVKHFAGYGQSEGGRDYNTVDMSDRTLREFYLPSYKAAIDAGCDMVMTSFNTIHGVPSTGNKYLMKDILRDEWGFDGVVISDWGAVGELIVHGVAKDEKEAAKLAINASVDIEMMTSAYINNLKKLINEGSVSENIIDEAVLRVLKLKENMGLFDNPFGLTNQEEADEVYLCESHRRASRDVASKSMVLLKNDGILPLDKHKKIAVIGPFGNNQDIIGAWGAIGKIEDSISLLQGIVNKVGDVPHVNGCEVNSDDISEFGKAISIAKDCDVIILALGESSDMSGEANCRADIGLPGVQEKLVDELAKLNKPIVTVLFNGRPLDLKNVSKKTSAILEAWHPGTEGGNAVADILFGDVNPSGKLSMSIPYSVGQIPVYYNHYLTGRPKEGADINNNFVSRYLDIPNEPLYPFGYGLSYNNYIYSAIDIDKKVIKKGEKLTASITVKNTGNYLGTETVQLYIRDLVSTAVRPIKELKSFAQVTLKANEEAKVEFVVTEEMLKFHNSKNEFVVEDGEFELMIGKSSVDFEIITFQYIK